MLNSPLLAAFEEAATNSIIEKELCYFVKVTPEQFHQFMDKFKDVKRLVFSESKLRGRDHNLRTRIRHYIVDDNHEYELTVKTPTDDKLSKTEDNVELSDNVYRGLYNTVSDAYIRARFRIPAVDTAGNWLVDDIDECPEWEIDLYRVSKNLHDNIDGYSPWIKVELTLKNKVPDEPIQHIPFEYEELIDNESASEEERAFITSLYEREYNVYGMEL